MPKPNAPCETVELHLHGEVCPVNSERHVQALRAWKECWSDCQPGEAMLLDLAGAHFSPALRAVLAAFLDEATSEGHSVILRNAHAELQETLKAARRLADGSLVLEGR